jgi:hypothetical protein
MIDEEANAKKNLGRSDPVNKADLWREDRRWNSFSKLHERLRRAAAGGAAEPGWYTGAA